MLSFLPKTPIEILKDINTKFRQRRKSLKLTQIELSEKSSVSLGSIKRFEQSGQISFESLLKLSLVLECLSDFEKICDEKEELFGSIEEVIN